MCPVCLLLLFSGGNGATSLSSTCLSLVFCFCLSAVGRRNIICLRQFIDEQDDLIDFCPCNCCRSSELFLCTYCLMGNTSAVDLSVHGQRRYNLAPDLPGFSDGNGWYLMVPEKFSAERCDSLFGFFCMLQRSCLPTAMHRTSLRCW